MDRIVLAALIFTLAANGVLLGLLLRSPRSVLRVIFMLYVASIAGWTLSILLFLFLGNTLLSPWIFFFATTGLTAQLWFAETFPENKLPENRWTYWSIALSTFFAAAGFAPGALFAHMYVDAHHHIVSTNGYLSAAYALFIIAYFCIPIGLFARKLAAADNAHLRAQLRYLIIGFSLFLAVSISTNIILPIFFENYFFNTLGPTFSLVFVATSFYIIWQHQFLDMRLIIMRSSIYAALFLLIAGSYFGTVPLLVQSGISTTLAASFAAFVFLLVSGGAIYGIERYFERTRLLERERAYAITLSKQVAERTTHLEDLQAYQRRMTSDIAHALQTPLTVLTSAIESLSDTRASDKRLAAVKESADRLSQLMYALLHLSRLETLPIETRTSFSLSNTLTETLEYIDTICTEQGIQLRHTIAPDIMLTGDPEQMKELLTNLLSNAVRYTQHASRKEISVSLTRTEKTVQIVVSDTGVGIAPNALPHVFERFYRAPDNAESGTGLGLAIVKRITELHGGTITVDSTLRKGAVFTVSLPLSQETNA